MIKVPIGTQILSDDDERTLLADLTKEGEQIVFLRGGDGGRGNASYKTSTNRAPRQHGTGWPYEEAWVWLRLKLLADAGLVGLPNAGKSTFINQVTNAQAKVGAYAFTTTRPQLGVVRHKQREFVVADIPGLIEGAAEGAGIGDRFLGHIERCRVLLHLVDANDADVAESYRIVRDELENYGAGLTDKKVIVALNKIDTLDDELVAALSAELEEASGAEVIPLSGAAGTRSIGCSTNCSRRSGPRRARSVTTTRARTRSSGRRCEGVTVDGVDLGGRVRRLFHRFRISGPDNSAQSLAGQCGLVVARRNDRIFGRRQLA